MFIRARKLNVSLVFITQSYFKVRKDVRLNTTHFFIAVTPNERELKQIGINHSSDISTKDFTNIYEEFTAEPYPFFVNNTTLAPNNPLRFRKNLFNIMTINDQIRDEKLQYDINRKAAKISALSSGEIHKYGYLTGEDILPSNQQQIMEQARFLFLLWKKLLKTKQKQLKIKGKSRLIL